MNPHLHITDGLVSHSKAGDDQETGGKVPHISQGRHKRDRAKLPVVGEMGGAQEKPHVEHRQIAEREKPETKEEY